MTLAAQPPAALSNPLGDTTGLSPEGNVTGMLDFIAKNFRWIAGGFLLTYFSSFGQTFFVAASVGEWRAAFGFSHGDFGRLYMAATLASAATLPFLGRIVDVIPIHRVIAFVVPVLAIACVAAAYAPTPLALVAAIYLLRLFGQGMLTHIALTAIGKWFDRHRGRAVSLVVLGHQGGEASLPLLFAAASAGYGFQTGWLAGAAALTIVALPVGVWAFSRQREPLPGDSATHRAIRNWTRDEVLRDPIFWVLLAGVLAPPFIGTTIFYHQDYMTEVRDWPAHLFPTSMTLMAMTTVVVALVNGAVIDRIGARGVLPFFLLPLGAACIVAAAIEADWGLYASMFLLGVSYGVSSTLFGALWPEVYGTENLGAVRSVTVSAMVFSTAAGPGLTGTLIDAGVPLATQLGWFGAYCLAVALLMGFAAKRLQQRA